MRTLLLFGLFFLFLRGTSADCDSICSFLYNNSRWQNHTSRNDTFFNVTVQPPRSLTGVITIHYSILNPDYNTDKKSNDYLRFIIFNKGNYNEYNQPLMLTIIHQNTRVNVKGRLSKDVSPTSNIEFSSKMNRVMQISDMDSDHYKIFYERNDRYQSLDYNYLSPTTWRSFQDGNVTLKNTVTVKNDGRFTIYKFISVCRDATPRLCDNTQHSTVSVNLSSPLNLPCIGYGAPFLAATWTRPEDHNNTVTETYDTSTPDHRITSTLHFNSVTVDHLRTYTCTISNKNFKSSVTKTFTLTYNYQVSVVSFTPNQDFYTNSTGQDTMFEWVVQGWPLNQVTLSCNTTSNKVNNQTDFYQLVPPRITFTLSLLYEDQLKCVLKNGTTTLSTHHITRVGYNCKEGERGVAKSCEVCPLGQTSKPGIGECHNANSLCGKGQWGIGNKCTSCPQDKTSNPGAVKVQECFTPEPEESLGLAAPIGGGVGGLVLIVVVVIVIVLLKRRGRPTKQSRQTDLHFSNPTATENQSDDPDTLYSVIDKPSGSRKGRSSNAPVDPPCDTTYAMLNRQLEENGGFCPDVASEDVYAVLDQGERPVSSDPPLSQDQDPSSLYTVVNKSGPSNEHLYTDARESNLAGKRGFGDQSSNHVSNRITTTAEEEEDVYASVELAAGSTLNTRQVTLQPVETEETEYTTISELKDR